MNQWEGERIGEILVQWGAERCASWTDADCIIVNGCTVTGRSEAKVRSALRRFERGCPGAVLVLTGCGAEEIVKGEGWAQVKACSQEDKETLPQKVWTWMGEGGREPIVPTLGSLSFRDRARAWVKVQDGCDALCAYCRIPLARPTMRSRPERDILRELEALEKRDKREVVLCGIRLGAYGKDWGKGTALADLVQAAAGVFGGRIRLSSLEPMDVQEKMLERLSAVDRLCRQLHFPAQSGDDDVLRSMNRRYTVRELVNLIERARAIWPDLGLTTDMISGFPGETKAAHQRSLELVERLIPHRVHVFPFSPRPGTAACTMASTLSISERTARARELREKSREVGDQWRTERVGTEVEVLWESRRKEGWIGRTSQDVPVSTSCARTKNILVWERVIGLDGRGGWRV